jgi:hypothetical protein
MDAILRVTGVDEVFMKMKEDFAGIDLTGNAGAGAEASFSGGIQSLSGSCKTLARLVWPVPRLSGLG